MNSYLTRLEQFKEDLKLQRIQDNSYFQAEYNYISQNWLNLDVDSRNQALKIFNELIAIKLNPMIRAMFAMIAGAMVEQGDVNPTLVLESVFDLFISLMIKGKKILELYKEGENSEKKLSEEEINQNYPNEFLAWKTLENAWLPMKALLIMSRKIRNKIKKHPQYDEIIEIIKTYIDYHSGVHWVYMALNIFDGEILVFHPETKRGYKVLAESIEHPFTLSNLLTRTLVGNPKNGLIPKTCDGGATQFWIFNWKVIQDLEKYDFDGKQLIINSPAYIGSSSMMDEILCFEDKYPIVFLVDLGNVSWTFDTRPSFPEIHPKMELLEILDEKTVEQWISKLKMG